MNIIWQPNIMILECYYCHYKTTYNVEEIFLSTGWTTQMIDKDTGKSIPSFYLSSLAKMITICPDCSMIKDIIE